MIEIGRSRPPILPYAAMSPAAPSRQVAGAPVGRWPSVTRPEAAPAEPSVESGPPSAGVARCDQPIPSLCDNFGQHVPVCAAELAVIETYLDQVLRELLATAAPAETAKRPDWLNDAIRLCGPL